MDENSNGHNHDLPMQTIWITFDPNHGTYSYTFENMNHQELIGNLEIVKQLAVKDMFRPAEETNVNLQSH